jgi:hypothetical protein
MKAPGFVRSFWGSLMTKRGVCSARASGSASAILLVLLAAFGGCLCSGKKRQQRTGDAAAVEPINTPLGDAGKAAGGDEVEPNDGDDVAMRLALGATVHGKIEPESDVDEFRIDIQKAGVLAIEVAVLDGDVALELEDGAGTVVAKSDRGAAKVKEGVPNFPVAPGRYTAIVKGRKPAPPKKGRKPPPVPVLAVYDITAQQVTPSAGAEHEPDDDRGTANELIVGDTANGYVGWSNDADVWKISVETLSAKNELEIELSGVEGIALSLELLDGAGAALATRKGPKGAALALRDVVPVLAAGAPPLYYVTVRADKSNFETAYQLHAVAKPLETDAEVEPNDTADKPYPVPEDRTVVNARWSAGDSDCFAVAPVAEARTLDVVIEVPREADLRGELFVDGKSLAKVDTPKKGVDEKLAGPVPPNGKAVVCVRGTDIAGEARYTVKLHDGPAAP